MRSLLRPFSATSSAVLLLAWTNTRDGRRWLECTAELLMCALMSTDVDDIRLGCVEHQRPD